MKKLILLTILLLATGIVAAQPKKGAIAVGGSIGFSVNSTSSSGFSQSSNYFSFAPSVEYFLSDKLSIGGYLDFTSSNQSSWTIAPGVTYYMPISNKLYFSLGGNIFFGGRGDATTFGLSVTPALNYYLTEHFSFGLSLGGLEFSSTSLSGVTKTYFGLWAGSFGPTINLSYTF